jgi:hypothetical protein
VSKTQVLAFIVMPVVVTAFGWLLAWLGRRYIVLSAIGGMIGLAVVGAALGAENTFDGVYTGKRVLTKDSGPGCPAEEEVSVIIQGKMLSFTNSALQSFIIPFNPHQDGSFNEVFIDPFDDDDTVTIYGRIAGGFLDADVINAPCEHHWRLKKG